MKKYLNKNLDNRKKIINYTYINWRGRIVRSSAHAWSACESAMAPWVRIPPSPNHYGRARWGGSGALFSQSALARLNSYPRDWIYRN